MPRRGSTEAAFKDLRAGLSNREIHLHDTVVAVLKQENPAPLSVGPDDYFFTTPSGSPIDVNNFYTREWLPILRGLKIRPRPFYNTRHTYVSFLYSMGPDPASSSVKPEKA